MAHHRTVFSQLLQIVPRHEFEALAREHHEGRKLRSISRWNQFVALATAQLTGRSSLRDIVSNLAAQSRKLYHLGAGVVSRSSLARVNEKQPASLFEAIFARLLSRCQTTAPSHPLRFESKLYSLDSSMIELTLKVFPWARYQATKGAIKLHVGLDHDGHLPAFVRVTEGGRHEIAWARSLDLPAGSMVVFDRGFLDYEWWKTLGNKRVRFVTRLKTNARYRVEERRVVTWKKNVTSDQTIRFLGDRARANDLVLRRVGYRDPETGKHYAFGKEGQPPMVRKERKEGKEGQPRILGSGKRDSPGVTIWDCPPLWLAQQDLSPFRRSLECRARKRRSEERKRESFFLGLQWGVSCRWRLPSGRYRRERAGTELRVA